MKISIVGSHGTGKTTTAQMIADQLDYNFIPDVVADAFKNKFEINENTPPETQFWILTKQIELQRNTPESWVMEKSLWDNIIYGSFSIKDKKVIDVIENIVLKNAEYDIVFYLPIEFAIEDDGLRSTNIEFQKSIDDKLLKYLKKIGQKYYTLSGSRDDRLKKAIKIVKKHVAK